MNVYRLIIRIIKGSVKQFLSTPVFRFLFVGGCCTCMDFILYILLSVKYSITFAKIISTVTVSLVSYVCNKNWTFRREDKTSAVYLFRYYMVYIINVSINVGVNDFVYSRTGYKIFAYGIAVLFATVIHFLLQKYYVFKR